MVILACSLVLLAYPAVAFGGRTFKTGWNAVGVNGFHLSPPGVDVPAKSLRPDAGVLVL